jgi:hypothetical protein
VKKKAVKKHFKFNVHQVSIKVVLLFFSMIYIFLFLLVTTNYFYTNDPVYEVKTLLSDIRGKADDFATRVKVGLHIKHFSKFNFIDNEFVFDVIVWFEFNSSNLTLDIVDKFFFENGKILSKLSPDIKASDDKIFVKYDVKVALQTKLDFSRFPLDHHRLSIALTNPTVAPSEMLFDNDAEAVAFTISKRIETPDWKVNSLFVRTGYTSILLDDKGKNRKVQHPQVVFMANFQRIGFKDLLVLFIPLFMIIFFVFFSFLMNLTSYTIKFRISFTSITALLAYRFIMEKLSPVVGYFTIMDKLYIFALVFCFCIFVFQFLMTRQYIILDSKDRSLDGVIGEEAVFSAGLLERYNSYCFFVVYVIFVIGVSFIFLL